MFVEGIEGDEIRAEVHLDSLRALGCDEFAQVEGEIDADGVMVTRVRAMPLATPFMWNWIDDIVVEVDHWSVEHEAGAALEGILEIAAFELAIDGD